MKKVVLFPILITILSLHILVSCDDNESDTQKPVINLIEPEEGAVLKPGSAIHFEMELSDNEMLRSYKVEIHDNFNNHGHESKATKAETAPFTYNKSWDVSGLKNTHIHHHEIEIPANATEGAYHFMVYCTDAAGNELNVARSIVLSKDGNDGTHE
ncbi:tRNA U55 pseudouridine synthase TruB [Parabacteroides sp. PF5-5]|uniref:DUF4625 domain-containing protein n=1 Tax=unclassified Parabacteroides TaxID=2649774 RepID=UPI002475C4BA|nr:MULTISPECIES: DUF4625 domain-containing protein [unclassified Parabacteroides]MDH6306308.1 tRNA U55 pseudouridine synthase TruB [Parabacteroides sp. PH5-39]MDH6316901.1 tRNA U55 pseudouridine synthase TruB [Parabacteroides sp. PF5-13]MDH6320970.1 tRNA U55 pseudouridine synthase TruB [Parabacteroides sp. PH5-13]MDH6324702.1 tRNA U55 pseudouridine synthase TruB [Parabacteroides sp. PH5-8]MDH6328086.1 tRNA U55 pseudouridine synthase TruB [Parabacteroides sp. PH5-41]